MPADSVLSALPASHSVPSSQEEDISHSHRIQRKNKLFESLGCLVVVQLRVRSTEAGVEREQVQA